MATYEGRLPLDHLNFFLPRILGCIPACVLIEDEGVICRATGLALHIEDKLRFWRWFVLIFLHTQVRLVGRVGLNPKDADVPGVEGGNVWVAHVVHMATYEGRLPLDHLNFFLPRILGCIPACVLIEDEGVICRATGLALHIEDKLRFWRWFVLIFLHTQVRLVGRVGLHLKDVGVPRVEDGIVWVAHVVHMATYEGRRPLDYLNAFFCRTFLPRPRCTCPRRE